MDPGLKAFFLAGSLLTCLAVLVLLGQIRRSAREREQDHRLIREYEERLAQREESSTRGAKRRRNTGKSGQTMTPEQLVHEYARQQAEKMVKVERKQQSLIHQAMAEVDALAAEAVRQADEVAKRPPRTNPGSQA